MVFWGDPLEELIDQLDQALPDDGSRDRMSAGAYQKQLVELQFVTDILLYGAEEQRTALRQGPRLRALVDRLAWKR